MEYILGAAIAAIGLFFFGMRKSKPNIDKENPALLAEEKLLKDKLKEIDNKIEEYKPEDKDPDKVEDYWKNQ
jgi:hypothetical protein